MTTNAESYLKAIYPAGLHLPDTYHLDDETAAMQLDKSARHSKAAHKAQERKRQKRAEAQAESEKQA